MRGLGTGIQGQLAQSNTEEEKYIQFVELKLFKCDFITDLTRLCIIQKISY